MPPFNFYAHYVAYGATDQQTLRELRNTYAGVVVPATIAAFQREGTGGFILSLSATAQSPPYFMDPRFPLFQQKLVAPKKSHIALSELLGEPSLISAVREPQPADFDMDRILRIAGRWAEFNGSYGLSQGAKFAKYAARLHEDMRPEMAQSPEIILAPYFSASGPDDPWWDVSERFFQTSLRACARDVRCVRVVCGHNAEALGALLASLETPEEIVVWASGMNEHSATVDQLLAYRAAISAAAKRGFKMFGLYGGFFSVLLGGDGLLGSSHGIGFSEHRQWQELPTTGAPPARYYLRRAHAYVSQNMAQDLYRVSPDLTACPCAHCGGQEPIALGYHDLMKHSVACRQEEIDVWTKMARGTAVDALRDEYDAMDAEIEASKLLPQTKARVGAVISQLLNWADALDADV